MPRKKPPDAPAPDPELRVDRAEAAAKIDERIAKGEELFAWQPGRVDEIPDAIDQFHNWDAYNNELLKRLFTTDKYADEYSWWGVASLSIYEPSPGEKLQANRDNIRDKIKRLRSIRDRLELIPVSAGVAAKPPTPARSHTNRVFVVHGHDEATRETVARFLERLDVDAIILHEKPTEGRTIVEKLEHYSDVDFAVVLLTPDDIGVSKTEDLANLQPRARQNVVLELGFFVGKLGRSHVCALYQGPLELPSDYLGVGYVQLDASGGWRLQLARELRSAGFSVDMNKAL